MYGGGKIKKQSIWRHPFCRRDKDELVYDHCESERERQTSWGLILFHLLHSQTGRLRQAYQSTSPSTPSFTMHALNHCIWDFLDFFLTAFIKGASSGQRQTWGWGVKIIACRTLQSKKQREMSRREKEESGMGVTPGSLTTVKSDKKITWKY